MIDSIGKRLESVDWKKLLATPLKMLGGMTEIVTKLTDRRPRPRAEGDQGPWLRLVGGRQDGPGPLRRRRHGPAQGLGRGLRGVRRRRWHRQDFSLAWDGLKLAMEAGAALFKTVLSGFRVSSCQG